MNTHDDATTGATLGTGMMMAGSIASTAGAMRRYRAVVEGIVETRKKVALCESMKADAQSALAAADQSLSYNLGHLVEAEAELLAIEAQCLN